MEFEEASRYFPYILMGITDFVFDDDEADFVIEEFLDSLDSAEEEGLKQPLVERETAEFAFRDEEDASLGEEDVVWYQASEDEPEEEAEDWEEHLNKEIVFLKEESLMLRERIYCMEREKKKFVKEWELSEKKRNEKLKEELAELCSIFIDLDIDCQEVESVNTMAVLEDSKKKALLAGSGGKGPDRRGVAGSRHGKGSSGTKKDEEGDKAKGLVEKLDNVSTIEGRWFPTCDVSVTHSDGYMEIQDRSKERMEMLSEVVKVEDMSVNNLEKKHQEFEISAGGTFDVSVLEVGDGVFDVLSISGDTHLGGDDFDKRIVDWLAASFERDEGIDLLKDKQALPRLTETAGKDEKQDIDPCRERPKFEQSGNFKLLQSSFSHSPTHGMRNDAIWGTDEMQRILSTLESKNLPPVNSNVVHTTSTREVEVSAQPSNVLLQIIKSSSLPTLPHTQPLGISTLPIGDCIQPVKGHTQFRSKEEVFNFLETGKIGRYKPKAKSEAEVACLEWYADLYGSDDRLHVCISELGIPLSREPGFHHWDVRGNESGIAKESAWTVLVAVRVDWLHNNARSIPIKSQFDTLMREGSLEWRNLCEIESYSERFEDSSVGDGGVFYEPAESNVLMGMFVLVRILLSFVLSEIAWRRLIRSVCEQYLAKLKTSSLVAM